MATNLESKVIQRLPLRKEFRGLAILSILYVLLSLLLPTDTATLAKYNISEQQAKILSFSIILPLVAIWAVAFNGYIQFKEYASSIKRGNDGKGFSDIAQGSKILAYGLPIGSITGLLVNYLALQNVAFFKNNGTILSDYISILITLIAFIFINKGARILLKVTKKIPPMPEFTVVIYLLLAISYCYVVFSQGVKPEPSADSRSVYSLPTLVVSLSVVLPYLYTWYKGLIAAYFLRFYEHNVGGVLYKRALRKLSLGIAVVILSSVLIQFFVALSNNIADLTLTSLLAVIYVLLIVMAFGYLLIAHGAKSLKQIEDVA